MSTGRNPSLGFRMEHYRGEGGLSLVEEYNGSVFQLPSYKIIPTLVFLVRLTVGLQLPKVYPVDLTPTSSLSLHFRPLTFCNSYRLIKDEKPLRGVVGDDRRRVDPIIPPPYLLLSFLYVVCLTFLITPIYLIPWILS